MIYRMKKELTFLIREKFTDKQLGFVRAESLTMAEYLVEVSTLKGKDYYLQQAGK